MGKTEQTQRRIVRNKTQSEIRREAEKFPRFVEYVLTQRKPRAVVIGHIGPRDNKVSVAVADRSQFNSLGFVTFGEQIEASCFLMSRLDTDETNAHTRIMIGSLIDGDRLVAIITRGTTARDMRSRIGEEIWNRNNSQEPDSHIFDEKVLRIYHTTEEASRLEKSLRAQMRERAAADRALKKMEEPIQSIPTPPSASFLTSSMAYSSITTTSYPDIT